MKELELDLDKDLGPLYGALQVVCREFGGQARFDVDCDDGARKELTMQFTARKLRVRFVDPTGHAQEQCKALGLRPLPSRMVVEGVHA